MFRNWSAGLPNLIHCATIIEKVNLGIECVKSNDPKIQFGLNIRF